MRLSSEIWSTANATLSQKIPAYKLKNDILLVKGKQPLVLDADQQLHM
jgi:hypothetical protein